MGAAGAVSHDDRLQGGPCRAQEGGKVEVVRKNIMETIKPGETVTNMNPGGGGYGNPLERPIEKVVWDVKNGLVSIEGAKRATTASSSPILRPSTSIMAATRAAARRRRR